MKYNTFQSFSLNFNSIIFGVMHQFVSGHNTVFFSWVNFYSSYDNRCESIVSIYSNFAKYFTNQTLFSYSIQGICLFSFFFKFKMIYEMGFSNVTTTIQNCDVN